MGSSWANDSRRPLAPLEVLKDLYGFVPRLFAAQAAAPQLVEAEVALLNAVLFDAGTLNREGKERILLGVAVEDRNVYCSSLHYRTLLLLGAREADLDRIIEGEAPGLDAVAPRDAGLVVALGKFLCTVAARLGVEPDFAPPTLPVGSPPAQFRTLGDMPLSLPAPVVRAIDAMRSQQGSRSAELREIEAAVAAGVAEFFATVRQETRPPAENLNLSPTEGRHSEGAGWDPDAEAVVRVLGGEIDAFEEIVRRNSRRVYRTLLAILGNPDEARDAMQDTFLKAFEHLSAFERRARFSTWLTSIASNTGFQLLRERRNIESLDDPGEEETFRPRQVRAWTDNPEQQYAKAELRSLVEGAVLRLPAKYRVAVMLRDIEQLTLPEAAAALGLGVPAFKSRLLRGRLMMREALAPSFSEGARGVSP